MGPRPDYPSSPTGPLLERVPAQKPAPARGTPILDAWSGWCGHTVVTSNRVSPDEEAGPDGSHGLIGLNLLTRHRAYSADERVANRGPLVSWWLDLGASIRAARLP